MMVDEDLEALAFLTLALHLRGCPRCQRQCKCEEARELKNEWQEAAGIGRSKGLPS